MCNSSFKQIRLIDEYYQDVSILRSKEILRIFINKWSTFVDTRELDMI